jgi:GT2 family glycosyltransferase
MEFDIVIPSMNVEGIEPLVLNCLRSIRRFSTDYRLIFIQNGDDLYDSVSSELMKHDSVLCIKNKTNLGFVKAVNQGLKESCAPYVVIQNNDTEATLGWLIGLKAVLTGKSGLSGPRSTQGSTWQGSGGPGRPVIMDVGSMLCFFCTMIRRDVIDTIGYLDEDFGIGFGDDDNYCSRAQAAGFNLVFVPNVFIPHHSRTTFKALYNKDEIQDMQDTALLKHFEKLPGISRKIYDYQGDLYRNHMKSVEARRLAKKA